jgi:hypothetical protein
MNTSEIKFRAKRVDNGEWVVGDLNQKPIHYDCQIIQDGVIHYSVDRKTVCQFVGRLKSGDEVYINDLIQHGETIRIVEYRNGNTCLIRQNKQDTILLSFSENPKKVGNIFDNPELLQDAS